RWERRGGAGGAAPARGHGVGGGTGLVRSTGSTGGYDRPGRAIRLRVDASIRTVGWQRALDPDRAREPYGDRPGTQAGGHSRGPTLLQGFGASHLVALGRGSLRDVGCVTWNASPRFIGLARRAAVA